MNPESKHEEQKQSLNLYPSRNMLVLFLLLLLVCAILFVICYMNKGKTVKLGRSGKRGGWYSQGGGGCGCELGM
jgi:hypothetical protein